MKYAALILAMVTATSVHADPPTTIRFGENTARNKYPFVAEPSVYDIHSVAIDTLEKKVDASGNTTYLANGVPVDAKIYGVTLWDGSRLSVTDAFHQGLNTGLSTQTNVFFGGYKEYIISGVGSSGSRDLPNHVTVEKIQARSFVGSDTYYLVLDDKGSHWVSWDTIKANAIHVTADMNLTQALKTIPKGSHISVSEGTLEQVMHEPYGVREISRIVDTLGERQTSVSELLRIRDVTLDPKIIDPLGKGQLHDETQRIRSAIDDFVAHSVKRAAPLPTEVRPEGVAKDAAEVIR